MTNIDPTADVLASQRQTMLEERDVWIRAVARAGDDAEARKTAEAGLAKVEKSIAATYADEAKAAPEK